MDNRALTVFSIPEKYQMLIAGQEIAGKAVYRNRNIKLHIPDSMA